MKLFHFYRGEDETGVSGTGAVVEGVEFTNGWCALRWISDKSSVCLYPSLEAVKAIHGHGGKTEIVVHDFEALEKRPTVLGTHRFEILMQIIDEASRITSFAEDPHMEGEVRLAAMRIREFLEQLEHTIRVPGRAA